MAVVFISPKKRQRTFFVIITLMFLAFLGLISFGVFLAEPKGVESTVVFNPAKINIDMSIFDSEKLKSLKESPKIGIQYNYKAVTKSKREETGFISADSIDQARKLLEATGLTVTYLKEVEIGRDNPFVPYYTVVPPAVITPATPGNPATTPTNPATTPPASSATTPATPPATI